MKLTKKLEAEILKIYNEFGMPISKVTCETFASILDENVISLVLLQVKYSAIKKLQLNIISLLPNR
jgi:hypothetical protein